MNKSPPVNQFWILDFRFWIDTSAPLSADPDHKGMGLEDFKLRILDLFRPRTPTEKQASKSGTKCGAGHEPKNLLSKIFYLKFVVKH
ncbi:hypothetical protein [Nostoc sp.]|uniref:hypothetical protein n=1 Tax=Nostoc sp. TaxID=1180 RepID=UPI002FFC5FA6